ncbi:ribitol-5-phosphate xylosyltransferase 1-like [Daphnia pulicaria]|uniref:ribitol-5-phosphate xylosyltransferase 1-like n=1 Tax=Daphnia pulicaria TaxID=35523 RepID=UPI001EEB2F09|nr:ribitol-5-phosphate xylosyltransferase 1-like [Daphnia pulicaria]
MTFSVKYRAVRVCIKYLAPFILLNCAVLFWLRNLRGNEAPIESADQLQKFESRISWSNNVVPTTAAASTFFQVDIQSRAPIGEYLWNHLIGGKKELLSHQLIYKGTKTVNGINFTFQSGKSEIISYSPNLVLIIDGSSSQLKQEKMWLNDILISHTPKTLFLVILGDGNCSKNQWIIPYLSCNGGSIDAVFIVRDKLITDESEIFQWPLGVATHRDFPLFFPDEIDILSQRPFVCNFFGTANTKGAAILRLFKELNLESLCYLKMSNTTGFDGDYIQAVSDSDLTLCPASELGSSAESYCIYEAFSLGSVPVVEEDVAVDNCGGDPLRLLKQHNAPFILVESLDDELGDVIANESRMNLQEKIARRATVVNWYANFRHHMASQFIRVLKAHINH